MRMFPEGEQMFLGGNICLFFFARQKGATSLKQACRQEGSSLWGSRWGFRGHKPA